MRKIILKNLLLTQLNIQKKKKKKITITIYLKLEVLQS